MFKRLIDYHCTAYYRSSMDLSYGKNLFRNGEGLLTQAGVVERFKMDFLFWIVDFLQ